MLRGRVASSLPRGMPLDSTPDPGGLASGLEGLVPRAQPPVPLFLLVRSNQKPPTPLLYYLSEGRRSFLLATRLGQIDVAEAN